MLVDGLHLDRDLLAHQIQLQHLLQHFQLARVQEGTAALQHALGIGLLVFQIGTGIATLLLGQLLVGIAQQTRQGLALVGGQQLAAFRQPALDLQQPIDVT